ncbi:MAG TPA: NADH-quinone oxidoreductase subunit NuoG [Terriglobales bacterium]|nr:NADH-quinone oxidoreductase subunit NuoG [Terriglobales bacterium]
MPENNSVHLTIDGRAITVPAGTLLIEACRAVNIEVPCFCYYPNLSVQAACRMCLVEIEKMPKLQTACTVPVAEGMVVRTDTPTVHKARKTTNEFLLTNHPLDCPVCDKGGECELQDMTLTYGTGTGRFDEPKRHRDEQQWSPVVFYDRPRCILCYRCVRVCGEGMDVWALGVGNRAILSTILPNAGDHLECEECGMCIDICPVGALTSGAYRYKTRPWEMKHVGAICTFCGDGCRTTLGVRNDRIIRGDNRDASGINGEFLCIKGRYGFDFTQHAERLKTPLARIDGELKPVSWAQALETVARRWRAIQQQGGRFGVIGSTRALNEESYQLQRLARQVLGTNNIDHHRSADLPTLYDALAGTSATGSAPPLAAAASLKTASAVLLVGGDPTYEHPLLAWNVRWGYRLSGTRLYVLHHREIKLRRQAHRMAVVAEGAEGAAVRYLAGQGGAVAARLSAVGPAEEKRYPQLPPPDPQPISGGLEEFKAELEKESNVVIIFGSELRGDDIRALVALGGRLAGQTRYIGLADHSNSHGAADMGLYPDLLPGYESVSDAAARGRFEALWGARLPAEAGLNQREMAEALDRGELAALYVVGANPLRLDPVNPANLRRSFLVVQDLFLTETAKEADIVLPALAAYEKTGTLTNTCGEVQATRRAAAWPGGKSDLEIIHALARLMGVDFGRPDPDRVFAEIRAHVKGYNVSVVQLAAGRSALAVPLNGAVPHRSAPHLIRSNHDTLFSDGTLGRYSHAINEVMEKRLLLPGQAR